MTDRLKKLFRNECFLIGVPYVLSYGLMLLNRGVFWEDWLLYNHTPADNIGFFRDLGFFLAWPGYLFGLLNTTGHMPEIARALTFLSFLVAAFALNAVLKTVKEMEAPDRIAVSALAAVFPYFTFRLAIGTLQYSLCSAFFFAGFWALAAYLDGRGRWLRPVSLLLFFAACTTRSFLMFYGMAALYLLYREGWDLRRTLVKYPDFVALPVVVFLLNKYLFPPMGEYATENYNAIGARRLLKSPFRVPKTFVENAVYAMRQAVPGLPWLAAAGVAGLRWRLHTGREKPGLSRADWAFLVLGALAFALGAIPYIAIKKNPLPGSIDRFQLLLPLGSALVTYYGFKLLSGVRPYFFAGLFTAAFTMVNIGTCLDYQAFWYKKLAVMEGLKPLLAGKETAFLVEDRTLDMHPIPFEFAFYEFAGFCRLLGGGQTRNFFYKPEDQAGVAAALPYGRERFNVADYKAVPPRTRLIIEHGAPRPGRLATLGLLREEYTAPAGFRALTPGLVKVSVEKLPVQAGSVRRP